MEIALASMAGAILQGPATIDPMEAKLCTRRAWRDDDIAADCSSLATGGPHQGDGIFIAIMIPIANLSAIGRRAIRANRLPGDGPTER